MLRVINSINMSQNQAKHLFPALESIDSPPKPQLSKSTLTIHLQLKLQGNIVHIYLNGYYAPLEKVAASTHRPVQASPMSRPPAGREDYIGYNLEQHCESLIQIFHLLSSQTAERTQRGACMGTVVKERYDSF